MSADPDLIAAVRTIALGAAEAFALAVENRLQHGQTPEEAVAGVLATIRRIREEHEALDALLAEWADESDNTSQVGPT